MQNYLISICLADVQKYKNIGIPDMQLFVLFPSGILERRKMRSAASTEIVGSVQGNNPYSGFH